MKLFKTCSIATAFALTLTLSPRHGVAAGPADGYPNRPIHIVVPYAPGGSTDPIARLVGQQLSEALKQPVIIDNKPGGGTMIGTDFVARAPADGYTILLASSSHAVNPSLVKKVNYDPLRDFTAVSLALSFPLVLLVNPNVPARNLGEFLALAKAEPGKVAYASGGVGAANHLAGEMFKFMSGTNLLHVPYKGGSPAMADVIGGQVSAIFGGIAQSLPQMRAGKLRALAVSGDRRSALAPEVPTIAEAGVPGYNVTSWNGFLVRAGTPPEIVSLLNAEITRILNLPATRAELQASGAEPLPTTPKEAQDFIAGEVQKWARLVEKTGITAE